MTISVPHKRIAIIGGGTAGVTTLKTLLTDIPLEERRGWEVILFEQRAGVGGVWLPDKYEGPFYQGTDLLPETPLYPGLITNTPHPTMTIPHFPFAPGTHLFPSHRSVQRYHEDILDHWDLWQHVRVNHGVERARWNVTTNQWQVLVSHANTTKEFEYDHLIVANGHNHYPFEPSLPGRKEWAKIPGRIIFHSIFFRHPEDFIGRNVLVVGGRASGCDVAERVVGHAVSVALASKDSGQCVPENNRTIPGVLYKPALTAFLPSGEVLFADNSTLSGIDTVVLATGYSFLIPLLTEGDHLDVVRTFPSSSPDHALATNGRGLRPVWQHLLSLDAAYPLGALWFVGLPVPIANGISAAAEALFIGHALADPELLPSRATLLAEVSEREEHLSREGLDPAVVGHHLVAIRGNEDDPGVQYQEGLIRRLRSAGHWPVGANITEGWRQLGRGNAYALKDAWKRIEKEGEESVHRWIGGARSEEEWADVMRRLVEWQKGLGQVASV